MSFNLADFLSVVASLIILEFLLSVDNALVNVSIARKLPAHQRASAVRLGIGLAAIFRVAALLLAALIIHNKWLKLAGALYLLYLMFDHVGGRRNQGGNQAYAQSYKKVVWHIAFADLVFSIDNVVSAVGLSRNIMYVIFGVLIGMAAILAMSKVLVRVIDRFPRLALTGYLIVGFIGAVMLVEEIAGRTMSPHLKFGVIVGMALFTIMYEKSRLTRRLFGPLLRTAESALVIPARLLSWRPRTAPPS